MRSITRPSVQARRTEVLILGGTLFKAPGLESTVMGVSIPMLILRMGERERSSCGRTSSSNNRLTAHRDRNAFAGLRRGKLSPANAFFVITSFSPEDLKRP